MQNGDLEMFDYIQNPDIREALERVQEYSRHTRQLLFVFVGALLVISTILLYMVYNLNKKVEEVNVVETSPLTSVTVEAPTTVPTNTPTATAAATVFVSKPSVQSTSVPTAVPTTVPTETAVVDCTVGYQAHWRFQCGDERVQIRVGFESIEAPFQVAKVDNETSRFNVFTHLEGSAIPNTIGDSSALVSFFVHTDNESSHTGLPELEFGPETDTWALSVQSEKSIITEYEFANEVFNIMPYGAVVEILFETDSYEPITAYFTVIDAELVWLKPLENNDFTSTGTALYAGLYGCNEGGTCLGVDGREVRDGLVFTNEEGDHDRLVLVTEEQVEVVIDGTSYELLLPLHSIPR